ncbi:TPA: SpaH/EbpB family LPXTG-anchored major pilin [Streptococcus pyogenes]|uniref:SpaH/EbpB family LPXTG-anchored major pilin n=1 Tax=Streptococcus pyogenes TaxID=1314 RepID=UPI000DA3BAA9|nr:SpaH/EbpB family LPXTG-anchored major pilin [Streptococcus pyogenes]SQE98300.1 cell wall surface anchor family protein [Streptococcus pyogenes]VGT10905.1 cell wall surface anchor family protein [Streptococcus pyogenes]VGT36715.1 cell wall surface anchor family protein [Streptococcus pyogenes]VHE01280.1 cell wall surface anchor family protein [Streptococcus pyogenes]VHJ96142.1 cell wall surface anchor family protein [Streptococcus pyogenes]
MKLSKKLLYSAMVLTMLTGATLAPVAQIATGGMVVKAEDTRTPTITQPAITTVNIFKLQGADFSSKPNGITNENGALIDIATLKDAFGTAVSYLPGVTFKYYRVREYTTSDDILKNIKTVADADNRDDLLDVANAQTTQPTDQGGKATVNLPSNEKVKYLFVESGNNSKQEGENKVVGYTAVPFILHLPVSNSDGKGYYNEVNVYPKNTTVNEPKVDKDVTKLGKDDDSYQIGEQITWFLKSTVPTNIDKLTTFGFKDTLSEGLSFAGDASATVTKVKFGDSELSPQDYSVNFEGTNKLTVSLTTQGIQTVKGLITGKKLIADADQLYTATDNTDAGAFLSVEVHAKLNEKAVMGKRIENKVELDYGHESDIYKSEVPTHEVPEVHTGGVRFEKVDATVQTEKLPGAEFGLYTDQTAAKPVEWTDELIKANQTAIDQHKFKEDVPTVGQPIVLKSGADGTFEIKGLKYGETNKNRELNVIGNAEQTGQTTYYLKELVAPKGYVVSQKTVEFNVTYNSYYNNPTQVDVGTKSGDATPNKVENNKRPEIPNTGGIGTAIFVVVGLVLMLVAAKGMKHHKEEN